MSKPVTKTKLTVAAIEKFKPGKVRREIRDLGAIGHYLDHRDERGEELLDAIPPLQWPFGSAGAGAGPASPPGSRKGSPASRRLGTPAHPSRKPRPGRRGPPSARPRPRCHQRRQGHQATASERGKDRGHRRLCGGVARLRRAARPGKRENCGASNWRFHWGSPIQPTAAVRRHLVPDGLAERWASRSVRQPRGQGRPRRHRRSPERAVCLGLPAALRARATQWPGCSAV